MEIKNMNKKAIIAIIAVIFIAIIGAILFLGSADLTLVAGDNSATLPSDYLIDEKGIAYNDDTGIAFIPVIGTNAPGQKMVFDTLKAKGNDEGYKKCNHKKNKRIYCL